MEEPIRTGCKCFCPLHSQDLLQALLEREGGEESETLMSAEQSVEQVWVVCQGGY